MNSPVAVEERLAFVRDRIVAACGRAGRDPGEVTLVGVSKGQPSEAVVEAWRAGLRDFGENYVQELVTKAAELAGQLPSRQWRMHFIGHLQTNKVRAAVDASDVIHSVDSPRLAAALERVVSTDGLPVFIQVNVAQELGKAGICPEEAPDLIARIRQSSCLSLQGLMTIPPVGQPEDGRRWFRALKALAAEHGIQGLSMGMTDDFEVAIEEGATHVRVGRAIFGERKR